MYAFRTAGYSSSVNQVQTGIVDYVPGGVLGLAAGVNQIDTGRLDYITGPTPWYSDVIIQQASGWSVNWELINMPWETINNIWEV